MLNDLCSRFTGIKEGYCSGDGSFKYILMELSTAGDLASVPEVFGLRLMRSIAFTFHNL
jgi:hypothetical protein